MPKSIYIFIVTLLLWLPQAGFAQMAANPCDGVASIALRPESPINGTYTTQIQSKLNNYTNYLALAGDVYKLCFDSAAQYSINQTLSFNVRSTKPVLIYGLNVRAIDGLAVPLISIGSNAAQVTLQNIHISNATQGIALAGKYHRIIDSEIAGIRDGGVGTGIDLRAYYSEIQHTHVHGFDIQAILGAQGATVSSGSEFNDGAQCVVVQGKQAKIKSSDIHHCSDVGIQVDAEEALIGALSAALYATDKNTIHDNGVGIFVSQGVKNKFAYNSIYGNKRTEAEQFSPDGGLQMLPDLLAQLERPELLLEEVDGVYYGLQCSRDEATHEVTARWIQVQNAKSGELVIYQRDQDSLQGKDFLLSCTVQADGKCPIVFPAELNIAVNVCGSDQLIAMALLTNENYSSIYNSNTFRLNQAEVATAPNIGGDGGPIIMPIVADNGGGGAPGQPVVAGPGGDSGDIFVADNGSAPGMHGADEEIIYETGSVLREKQPEGQALDGSAVSGGMASSCSLHPTNTQSSSMSYLLMFAALTLVSLQRKKLNPSKHL